MNRCKSNTSSLHTVYLTMSQPYVQDYASCLYVKGNIRKQYIFSILNVPWRSMHFMLHQKKHQISCIQSKAKKPPKTTVTSTWRIKQKLRHQWQLLQLLSVGINLLVIMQKLAWYSKFYHSPTSSLDKIAKILWAIDLVQCICYWINVHWTVQSHLFNCDF